MNVATPSASGREVRFLYSAVIQITHGDMTVRARALLDGDVAIPLMTESLAAQLKLPRTHDPIMELLESPPVSLLSPHLFVLSIIGTPRLL